MKTIRTGILILIAVIAFTALCKLLPDSSPPKVLIDTWSSKLEERGYRQAENKKPDNIPDDKQPPAGEPIVHAIGTVEDSTVEIIAVETPDGNKWLTGWVKDGDGIERQIVFDRLDWWDARPASDDSTDLNLIIETAWVNNQVDVGVGAEYQFWHPLGADLGAAVTIDLQETITTTPDWLAVSGRLSGSISFFTLGGNVGWRFGEDSGLHLGASAGLAIDL